jgi:hypothetical protein
MIWLTYRQHRAEALVAAVLLALVGLVGVVEGLRAPAVAASLGLPCGTGSILPGTCQGPLDQFRREFGWLSPTLPFLFILLPALVGPFLGAPLVAREHEFRTSLLVWSQGVTRTRWLATELLLFGTALLAGAILLAAVAQVAEPAVSVTPMIWYQRIEWSFPVMVGTALFALALGVFAGALTRRVLAAMLIALVAVGLARAGVVTQLRPALVAPIVTSSRRTIPPDAWIVSSGYVDADGRAVPIERLIAANNEFFRSGSQRSYNSDDYLAEKQGLYFRAAYQPKEREGIIETAELGLYVSIALALVAASLWLVRRRPA